MEKFIAVQQQKNWQKVPRWLDLTLNKKKDWEGKPWNLFFNYLNKSLKILKSVL